MTLLLNALRVQLGDKQFNFNLSAEAGEVHAILGKSGAGKSTLLNLVGGFLKPESGELSWNGSSLLPLTPAARPVTTLFQAHNLFDHLNVQRNLGLGVSPSMKLSNAQWQQVESVLSDVGLQGRGEESPLQLSGGEQQRVGLARCLLRQRPVMLLDEPYGALDEATRLDMLKLTQKVVSKHQLCVLMVTHNPDDVERLNATAHTLVQGELTVEK